MKLKELIERYNEISKSLSYRSFELCFYEQLSEEEYFESLSSYYFLAGQLEMLTEIIEDKAKELEASLEYDYINNEEIGVEYSIVKII